MLLLQKLKHCLRIGKIDNVVLVSSFITSYLLVRSISPISIHSKFVLISLSVKKFNKVMSWWLLTNLSLSSLLCQSSSLDRLSRNNSIHLLSLPSIELGAYLNIFSSKAPLKYMFNLVEQILLLLDSLRFICIHDNV